jgi:hypothetical protein
MIYFHVPFIAFFQSRMYAATDTVNVSPMVRCSLYRLLSSHNTKAVLRSSTMNHISLMMQNLYLQELDTLQQQMHTWAYRVIFNSLFNDVLYRRHFFEFLCSRNFLSSIQDNCDHKPTCLIYNIGSIDWYVWDLYASFDIVW